MRSILFAVGLIAIVVITANYTLPVIDLFMGRDCKPLVLWRN